MLYIRNKCTLKYYHNIKRSKPKIECRDKSGHKKMKYKSSCLATNSLAQGLSSQSQYLLHLEERMERRVMPHKHYSGFLLVSLMRTQPIGARGLRGNSQSAPTGSSHTPSCTAHIAADDGYVTADLDRSPSVEMWDLSADAVLHPSLYERFMCREIKRSCLQ